MKSRNLNHLWPVVLSFAVICILLPTYTVIQRSERVGWSKTRSNANIPTAATVNNDFTKVGIPFGDPYEALKLSESKLSKRVGFWETAIANGKARIERMQGPRTQTQYSHYEDLAGNGWTYEDEKEPFMVQGYNQIYKQLGIKSDFDNHITNAQSQSFGNCMFQDLAPTGGTFYNIYNPAGRMLMGSDNVSPYSRLQGQANITIGTNTNVAWWQRLPNLQKWSDVAGIVWSHLAGGQAGSLKYIFKQGIITPATQRIIIEAAGRQPMVEPTGNFVFDKPWPGYNFLSGSDTFAALMSTPHGNGIAFLLISHPDQFGSKMIESITIFTITGQTPPYHMLFTLTD
ncbi:uncharacterized protein KY384_002398 [Bacidia gigantensis]|uniref:uncharacterized protein n=1 Tax=Bacidia gigantensis TaxID=2732470 RepID=UPI001D054664|nr:uncharacterized protein KY384_002398 [Bacidia gigantensis]KAG8532521.1 hypothetical protein KY384_002398 [Bacidia gigantensis]